MGLASDSPTKGFASTKAMSRTGHRGLKTNPTGSRSTDSDIDQDSLYGILSNSRRRHVIRSLAQFEPVELNETAKQIAAIEQDKPVQDLSGQDRKRVYIGLYQTHLPKLDRVDVVDWDKNRGTISRGPIHNVAFEALDPVDESPSMLERVRNFVTGGASA